MANPLRTILRLFRPMPREPRVHLPNVHSFITALSVIAPSAGRGSYAFINPGGGYYGYVQFIIHSDRIVEIHRLWTHEPGKGHGTLMMRKLCDLADGHGMELKLKALPIGRKPHPMSREQLKVWYEGHAFAGAGWKLVRKPAVKQSVGA
jgi:hypothetical protein